MGQLQTHDGLGCWRPNHSGSVGDRNTFPVGSPLAATGVAGPVILSGVQRSRRISVLRSPPTWLAPNRLDPSAPLRSAQDDKASDAGRGKRRPYAVVSARLIPRDGPAMDYD